jgi:alpha-beta hydrolase superfamily lysophospholipase
MATLGADLRAAVRTVRARHPDAPLFALGVSMGGAVVMTALADAPIEGMDGAVLVAPAVWGRRHMNLLERSALWLLSNTMPWLTLNGRGLEIRPSDNIAMLRALGRDPRVIKETRVDAILGLVDLMDAAFESAARLDSTPLLVAYGSRDEIVPKAPIVEVMRRLRRSEGVRLALYDSGYHMLLRDVAAEIVWRDIAAWVGDRGATLPSGAERQARALLAREHAAAD